MGLSAEFLDAQLEIVRKDRSEWRRRAQVLQIENGQLRAIIRTAQSALQEVHDV